MIYQNCAYTISYTLTPEADNAVVTAVVSDGENTLNTITLSAQGGGVYSGVLPAALYTVPTVQIIITARVGGVVKDTQIQVESVLYKGLGTEAWLGYTSPLLAKLNIQTDSDIERIQAVIAGVQAYIEGYCHRTFALTTHDETQIVGQDGSISLKQYPIVSISRVSRYNTQGLTISNTSAQVATYSTSPIDIRLYSITNGTATVTELDYETYPTLSTLKTAIEGHGFTCGLSLDGNLPSSDIISPTFAMCKTTAQIPVWQDYQCSFDYKAESGLIDGLLNSGYALGFSTPTAINLSGMRDIKFRFVYEAGFVDIPSDLKLLTANLAISAYNGSKEVESESLQGWSYRYFNPDKLTMSDRKVLEHYRKRVF